MLNRVETFIHLFLFFAPASCNLTYIKKVIKPKYVFGCCIYSYCVLYSAVTSTTGAADELNTPLTHSKVENCWMVGCFLRKSSICVLLQYWLGLSPTLERKKLKAKQIPAYFHKDTQTHPLFIYLDSLASRHFQDSKPPHPTCPHLSGHVGSGEAEAFPRSQAAVALSAQITVADMHLNLFMSPSPLER